MKNSSQRQDKVRNWLHQIIIQTNNNVFHNNFTFSAKKFASRSYHFMICLMTTIVIQTIVSCANYQKEQRLKGKWRLVEMCVSTDGGKTYESYPAEGQVLILLDDGVALYPDGILGVHLDSAQWRVYSNGDSLEIHDEQRKYTGMYDNYRIANLYTQIPISGAGHEMMDLTQTGENNSMLFGGASTITVLMRYEKEVGWSQDQLENKPESSKTESRSNSQNVTSTKQANDQDRFEPEDKKPRVTRTDVFQMIAERMKISSNGLCGVAMTDPIGVAIKKVVKTATPEDFLWQGSWVEWKEKVEWETIVYRLYPNGPVAIKDDNNEPVWADDVIFDLEATVERIYDEDIQQELIDMLSNKAKTIGVRLTDDRPESDKNQYFRIGSYTVYVGIGPGEVKVHYYNKQNL